MATAESDSSGFKSCLFLLKHAHLYRLFLPLYVSFSSYVKKKKSGKTCIYFGVWGKQIPRVWTVPGMWELCQCSSSVRAHAHRHTAFRTWQQGDIWAKFWNASVVLLVMIYFSLLFPFFGSHFCHILSHLCTRNKCLFFNIASLLIESIICIEINTLTQPRPLLGYKSVFKNSFLVSHFFL